MRAVITELRPAVVVTYDQAGGYGHPDHIRCHDAVVAAVRGIPVHQRPLTYAVLTPQSWAREDRRWLAAADLPGDWTVLSDPGSYPPSVVPDEVVTHATVAPEQVATQAEALRAHETQVIVTDGAWALSNLEAGRLSGREGFALINVDTVVTTVVDGIDHVMTASTFTSVSLDPLLVLVNVEIDSRFHDAIAEASSYGVTVLTENQRAVASWFATRGRPLHGQLGRCAYHRGPHTGVALLDEGLATFECRLVEVHPAGDHSIVIGEVVGMELGAGHEGALLHYRGQFHRLD